eukprot:1141672-Pelagomonas_calceolata.AAC.1
MGQRYRPLLQRNMPSACVHACIAECALCKLPLPSIAYPSPETTSSPALGTYKCILKGLRVLLFMA